MTMIERKKLLFTVCCMVISLVTGVFAAIAANIFPEEAMLFYIVAGVEFMVFGFFLSETIELLIND